MTTMLLTPENIQNQQFNVRFRGFDVDEVDVFLEKVAENYLVLVKENEKLKNELAAIQGERDQVQSQERTFKNAIISAQTIADEMQAKAQQEAHVIKENARLEVETLLNNAKEEEVSLKEQISSLLLEKQKLKDDLTAFLMTHMDRLHSQYPDDGHVAASPAPPEQPQQVEEPEPTVPQAHSIIGDIGGKPNPAAPEEEQDQVFSPVPEEPEVELGDLYEKIDLSEIGEDGLVEPEPSAVNLNDEDSEGLELNMPDLEGDMLFSLDDPLDDDLGPEINLDPSEKTSS